MKLIDSIKKRRTYYALSDESSVNDEKIKKLLEVALRYTPSAFNMQSARIVLLTGKAHQYLWTETLEILKNIIPEKNWPATTERINSFRAAYGTVLFFEDTKTIRSMKNDYPIYAQNFDTWASQGNGMLQLNVWMLLENEKLGASLQHYNPLIDEMVQHTWNLPKSWKLIAQMPFGVPVKAPEDKSFLPIKERIKSYTE